MDYDFDWPFVLRILPRFIDAVLVTLQIYLTKQVIATTGALAMVAMSRAAIPPLTVALRGFSWLFRGLPELIVLLFAYLALPHFGVPLSPFWAATLGLAAISMAYEYEIFRAALLGVPAGQFEAARALGISRVSMYRRIISPQMFRIALPAYVTFACSSLKRTSVASAVAVPEIMGLTRRMIEAFQKPFELMLIAMVLYVLLSSILMYIEHVVDQRLSPRSHGGVGEGRG